MSGLDPTVQSIVDVSLAILGIVISLIIYFKERPINSLSYKKQTLTYPILFRKNEEALRKAYQSSKGKKICLAVVDLFNSGNQSIIKTDYEQPIKLTFGRNSKILFSEITNRKPKNLGAKILFNDGKTVELTRFLFNPNNSLTIKTLVTNLEDVYVSCRAPGIEQANECISKRRHYLTKNTFLLFTIFISLVGTIFLQPLSTNDSYFLLWQAFIAVLLMSTASGAVFFFIWIYRIYCKRT
jgi:hypothetical protein